MRTAITYLATMVVASMGLFASVTAAERLTAASWLSPVHTLTLHDYTNFAKSVEEASGGEIKFDVHVGGALMPVKAALDGIRDGIADVGNILSAYTPADQPRNNIVNDISFVVDDPMAAAFAVTEIHFTNAALQKEWADGKVVYGGGFSTPVYYFMCITPVRTAADVKGKKVRTAGGSHVEWIKTLEGVPVSVPFTEVYTGLERGSLDCVMMNSTDISAFKIWEVGKSVTMLPMGTHTSGASWIYNKSRWSKLSPEHRRLLLDQMAIAAVRRQMDYVVETEKALNGSWERGLERIEPDQTLVDALAAFTKTFVEGLPQQSEEKRKVPAAEAAGIITDFQTTLARWKKLLAGVDRKDEAALIQLVKSEIYDKIDEAKYGL